MVDTVRLQFPKLVAWAPQEDITAYEFAKAISVLFAMAHGNPNVADQVADLPEAAQRHFRVSENPMNK